MEDLAFQFLEGQVVKKNSTKEKLQTAGSICPVFCSNAKWFPKDNLPVRAEHQMNKLTQGCSNATGGACSEGWDEHLAVLLALKLLTVEPGQSLWTHEPEGLFIFPLK